MLIRKVAIKGKPGCKRTALTFPNGSQAGKKNNFIVFLSGTAFIQAGKRPKLPFLAKPLAAGLAQVSRAQLAQGVPSSSTKASLPGSEFQALYSWKL